MPEREREPFDENGDGGQQGGGSIRLDKWLWYARVAKTRSLAAALVERGKIRVNRVRTIKPAQTVRPGDVITASVGRAVKILKVVELGTRRGPASEAQGLYEDLSTPPAGSAVEMGAPTAASAEEADMPFEAGPPQDAGSGRPSKKQRRQIVRLKREGR